MASTISGTMHIQSDVLSEISLISSASSESSASRLWIVKDALVHLLPQPPCTIQHALCAIAASLACAVHDHLQHAHSPDPSVARIKSPSLCLQALCVPCISRLDLEALTSSAAA